MNESLLGPARSECAPSVFSEEESEKQLSVADLVRFFIAGQLYVDPAISNDGLMANIYKEFQVSEGIMVFGDGVRKNIWIAPEQSDQLQKRFGGVPVSDVKPLDESGLLGE